MNALALDSRRSGLMGLRRGEMSASAAASDVLPLRRLEELTLAEIRRLRYDPTMEDLATAGVRAPPMLWNSRTAKWRRREYVNGGAPTKHEARIYRLRLVGALQRLFNGCCMGCGRLTYRRDLVLDHDHDTGLVRGALCNQCNLADELAAKAPTVAKVPYEPIVLTVRTLEHVARVTQRVLACNGGVATDAELFAEYRRELTPRELAEMEILPGCPLCGDEIHVGTGCGMGGIPK